MKESIVTQITTVAPIDSNFIRCWNSFFSSLAFAEEAAAKKCELVSRQLDAIGETKLADLYKNFATEEYQHFALASSACRNHELPPARAQGVYRGELFSACPSFVERMAVVHLVFEPSAVAFLGYVYKNAYKLFSDRAWAKQIRRAFGAILRDEIGHIQQGRTLVAKYFQQVNEDEKKRIRASLRRHRAFLTVGLHSFFKEYSGNKYFLEEMIDQFNFRYSKAIVGVIA